MYFRLIFRSQNRIMGSSYGNPKFKIAIPFKEFGSGNCKIVFEAFDGYCAKGTNAYNSIVLSIANTTFTNEIQTDNNDSYTNSGGICCISYVDKISNDYFYHHIENKISKKKGLILPCSFFNNGFCEFYITNLDGTVISEPTSVNLRYYSFSLGVFIDDEIKK